MRTGRLLIFFAQRWFSHHPWPISIFIVISAISLICTATYWNAHLGVQKRYEELIRISDNVAQHQKVAAIPAVSPLRLSEFQNQALTNALATLAATHQIPIEEIAFELDRSGNVPYLRYRATLTVSGGYRPIRTLLGDLKRELGMVSLDNIACTRSSISASQVKCEVTLSVFSARGKGV